MRRQGRKLAVLLSQLGLVELAVYAVLIYCVCYLTVVSVNTPNVCAAQQAIRPLQGSVKTAQERLHELVATHPSEEIRRDFVNLAGQGKLGVSFRCDENAQMGVDGHVEVVLNARTQKFIPMIFLCDATLLDNSWPDARHYLTLFHEFQHVKQFWAGRRCKSASTPPTRDELRCFFESEIEAYSAECMFAASLEGGAYLDTYSKDLCRRYLAGDIIGFRRAYAEVHVTISQNAPYKDEFMAIATADREKR